MSSPKHIILVPYDFTFLSECALKQAVGVAKITELDIVILHIVNDLDEESAALNKLDVVAKEFTEKYGVNIIPKIRPGKVHRAIKIFAETIDAFCVILKSDPPEGREKYFGSRTIRMMKGSRIPFFTVQEAPKRLGFRKIVFPIDFRKENKEKLIWISILSKYYTSKIYLFKPNANDYRIRNNIEFSKRFLEGKNIDYEIVSGKHTVTDPEEVVDFAHEIDAQLIIIMLSTSITKIKALLMGVKEQEFITNKFKIPIMCLNPRAELHKYEGFHG